MDSNPAVALVGAAIQQALSDRHSKGSCEYGAHTLGSCASEIIQELMSWVAVQPDEITPTDIVEEFLRLANGS